MTIQQYRKATPIIAGINEIDRFITSIGALQSIKEDPDTIYVDLILKHSGRTTTSRFDVFEPGVYKSILNELLKHFQQLKKANITELKNL